MLNGSTQYANVAIADVDVAIADANVAIADVNVAIADVDGAIADVNGAILALENNKATLFLKRMAFNLFVIARS